MTALIFRTSPELPAVEVPTCPECQGLLQCPNDDCTGPHGAAQPHAVMRQICVFAGHVLTAAGRSLCRCARCRTPRNQVVS